MQLKLSLCSEDEGRTWLIDGISSDHKNIDILLELEQYTIDYTRKNGGEYEFFTKKGLMY